VGQDLAGIAQARLVDEVVELVTRQRANRALRVRPRQQDLGAAQLPPAAQLGPVAGERDDVVRRIAVAVGLSVFRAGRKSRPEQARAS